MLLSEENKKRKHVSFSELYTFANCPQKHHIQYTLKQRDPPTIHTVYGNALHNAIDKSFKSAPNNDIKRDMCLDILEFCNATKEEGTIELAKTAVEIYDGIFDWLEEKFPNSKVIASEFRLLEPIEKCTKKFKGYIDLILLDDKGYYHIIDFKTSKAGWSKYQTSDTLKMYQIILYKNFFAQKKELDPKIIECHYIILKQKAPKKTGCHFELYTITSGAKKCKNAYDWLVDTTRKIEVGVKIKWPQCKFCTCK